MRIAYIVHQFYPEFYTGTEKFVLNVASQMQRLGHEVEVYTYSFYSDRQYPHSEGNILYRSFLYKGIPVTAIKHRKPALAIHDSLSDPDVMRFALRAMREKRPDVVHVAHAMRMGSFLEALHELGIPYVMTLTDFWHICPQYILFTRDRTLCEGPDGGRQCAQKCKDHPIEYYKQRLALSLKMLRRAKLVTAPSRFLAGTVMEAFDNALNIVVENHGIRYSMLSRNSRTYTSGDPLTFFYGGSLTPHKGVNVLLKAMSFVDNQNVSLKVYGSGPTEYEDALKHMARKDRRIEFMGVFAEDEVGKIMSEVDLTVVPSLWYENYPLVLHESLACNVPVVASDAGGMAEKIKNGEMGYVFELGNPVALSEALRSIADNPEQLNAIKSTISRYVNPTIEQEAYAYERYYKESMD